MNVLVLHHDDLDGRVAGYIAVHADWDGGPNRVSRIEMNYDKDPPWDAIKSADVVVIVDFSFPPAVFKQIQDLGKQLIWIDHHKTAIASVELAVNAKELAPIEGTRALTTPSGARLTWEYFHPDKPVPPAVDIVSRYDTWEHKNDPRILAIVAALSATDILSPPIGEATVMKILLENDALSAAMLDTLENQGLAIRKAETMHGANLIITNGYRVQFDGKWWWACNGNRINSLVFEKAREMAPGRLKDVVGWMPFKFTGRYWEVSLYRAADVDGLDVSAIAKKNDGGGHPSAAGFNSVDPPYPCPDEDAVWIPEIPERNRGVEKNGPITFWGAIIMPPAGTSARGMLRTHVRDLMKGVTDVDDLHLQYDFVGEDVHLEDFEGVKREISGRISEAIDGMDAVHEGDDLLVVLQSEKKLDAGILRVYYMHPMVNLVFNADDHEGWGSAFR